MSTKNLLILVVVGILILGAVYVLGDKSAYPNPLTNTPEINGEPTIQTYSSPEYKIAFDFSTKYLLLERDSGTPEIPIKSILIIEDTKQNRDIAEGKLGETGEGPTSITVDIFTNTKDSSVEDWVKENTGWMTGGNAKNPIDIDGKSGLVYHWDGLYAGKSAVVVSGNNIYVFSVTWITPEDQILQDFQTLLSTVKFGD